MTTTASISDGKLALSILAGLSSQKERTVWQDDENSKPEAHIADIAVQVVLAAEVQYWESAVRHHQVVELYDGALEPLFRLRVLL